MSTAVAGAARADTVVVDGRANIFGAGRTVAPDPGSAGPGLLPTAIVLFDAPERLVTFDTVTGLVSAKAVHPWWNGADGGPYATGNTDILSYAGISGIKHDGATMFLVGVFTDGHEPAGDAPVRLDATLHTEALVISPLLFQTFFIGDGRTGTGSGSVQVFNVPHGARMLYLGFADAYGFGDPIGLPGSYDDNGGELHVTFTIVPAHPRPTPTSNLNHLIVLADFSPLSRGPALSSRAARVEPRSSGVRRIDARPARGRRSLKTGAEMVSTGHVTLDVARRGARGPS
ncbi:MAG: hypothetical protein L6Q35_06745, partial [Phycisphaerales bacterium]|nr:hypothetical protein [Phycisphaerales bacterium]